MTRKRRKNYLTVTLPDLSNLKGTIDRDLVKAMKAVSKKLDDLGIPHALVGGLAVGAYGYVRATDDIDFVLGEEGFEHHGPLVSLKAGVPWEYDGYGVDPLSKPEVDDQIREAPRTDGVPVLGIGPLVYLKLKANRRRDKEDIIELLCAGAEEGEIVRFLETLPDSEKWIAAFDKLAAEVE